MSLCDRPQNGEPGEHLAALPAGEAHQVALCSAGRQPLVSVGVPELVRVDVRQPGRPAAALDGLLDAGLRQSAPFAQPQPGLAGAGRFARARR
jgi:hypothetical protein